jgi:hypothetical protein
MAIKTNLSESMSGEDELRGEMSLGDSRKARGLARRPKRGFVFLLFNLGGTQTWQFHATTLLRLATYHIS